MTVNAIPFAKPFFFDEDIESIKDRIEEVLRSGWLTDGPVVRQFEEEFACFVGTKYTIGVNSCTAALHATLLALGLRRGDEVIVPSDTFVATANAALYVSAKPVFADSDPQTFNISVSDIERRITKKTKAIIVVHLGGNPCDMKEIQEIAEDHKLILIEDCAHAHGAKYKEMNCGGVGAVGCFSFYPTKVMTSAEGGMVTTDDYKLATKIKMIKNHGRAVYGPAEIFEVGYNYRLTDVHAVIGLAQLKHLNEFIKHRNSVARFYDDELSKVGWLRPQKIREGNSSSYYAYIAKLEDYAPIGRDELASKLKEKGIGTSILYHPVHLQPFYVRQLGFQSEVLPVAEDLGRRTIALPMYNNLSFEEAKRVVETIKQVAQEIPSARIATGLRV